MVKKILMISTFCLSLSVIHSSTLQAQSTEERFQDVFITAGYATAFGAALGAALLSFHDNPAEHLRYIAVGASLGFIGGSILGSYVVFSPMVMNEPVDAEAPGLLSQHSVMKDNQITIRPVYNLRTAQVSSVQAGINLLSF